MMIEISKIRNNPYRDEALDPIDENKLVSSIGTMGFWGGLAVRKVADGYELAFGHHRLYALRKVIDEAMPGSEFCNMEKADIKVVDYDDDQMIRAMVIENSSQRGGEGGGNIDAVSAMIRRLGYLLLTKSDEELRVLRNSEGLELFSGRSAVGKARSNYLKGEGIGSPLIAKYASGAVKRDDIVSALKWLKTGAYLAEINNKVMTQIAIDEAKAKEAEAKIKQKAKKAEAAEKAKRLAKAKRDAAKIEIDEVKHVDITVNAVLKRTSHSDAFLEIVNTPDGRNYLPAKMHVAMAEKIIEVHAKEELKTDGTEKAMSARYVKDSVAHVLHEAMGVHRKEKKRLEQDNVDIKADKALKSFIKSTGNVADAVVTLLEALDDGASIDSNTRYNAVTFFTAHVKPLLTQLEELETRLQENQNVISYQ